MTTAEPAPTGPSQEERLMAALSHLAIILPFMGVIAPTVIWVTQKDKSRYVGFQALQAVIYQLVLILVGFIGGFCYVFSFVGMFLGSAIIGGLLAGARGEPPIAPSGPAFGIPFAFPFLMLGLIFLIQILLDIYGIIGAVLTLQGKDFRYVILGTRVKRYLQQSD